MGDVANYNLSRCVDQTAPVKMPADSFPLPVSDGNMQVNSFVGKGSIQAENFKFLRNGLAGWLICKANCRLLEAADRR